MYKIISLALTILLGAGMLLPLASVRAAGTSDEHLEQVEVWRRTDIILTSSKAYDNPFLDVDMDAVFTHEDGTEIHLYGFWNGENEWRVRFSPTKTGVWKYSVSCSDPSNDGLHQEGSLLAVPNTGETALDQHGFVRISDNGRYFTYDDGTPFYWLGDTNWQAPNYVSVTQCNYPGCACENQFQHEVDDRLDKGFTVYQTYFDSGENDGGGQLETTEEPSLWLEKYDLINPDTFTNKIDLMFDYLADKGMVIALGCGVHFHTTNGMGQTGVERSSRYLTARYASYPIVWITAQEITGEPQYSIWKRSAEIVDAGDGYNHPQGTHMFPTTADNTYIQDLDQQEWHDWWAVQGGHGPVIRDKSYYRSYWDNGSGEHVKPFLETESNYEDIVCGGFNGYDASRISAWKANLCGSYGFTYGVTGIWANNYSTAGNMGWYGSFSFEPWYMGLDKPGSYEMTYLRRFFEYVDFSSLVPRFDDTAYSDFTDENKVVASSEDSSIYVAYFYNANLTTGELRGLHSGKTYSARWYNPLTGKFIDIATGLKFREGVYSLPSKPTTGDWALVVTSRDLGAYETEEPYTDPLIQYRENLALGAGAVASSDNGSEYSAARAVDGDPDTYWCAANGDMPQYLQIDMKEARDFKEVEILMHQGNSTRTEKLSYTLLGSLDGSVWETIYTAQDEKPVAAGRRDRLRITAEGRYRYLRVEYTDITTNWAAVYEFAVYADAVGESLPEESESQNLALNAFATASSSTLDTPDRAVDGDSSSYWCAASGNMPQWIQIDMREPQAFRSMQISMYGGTEAVSYTLSGSLDGEDWTVLHTGDGEATVPLPGSNSVALQIDLAGEYQYLRIDFTEVQGNWATVVEWEVLKETAETEDDVLPDYAGSMQTPVVTSVGTAVYTAQGDCSNSADALFDGDENTVWSPYAPIATQTILMDLLQQNKLNGIQITLGENAVLPAYRIEASQDGRSWTILADATLREASVYRKGGRTVVCEALSGNYRYVKLLWLNTSSNSAIKTIAGIRLYADSPTPEQPEALDISGLQKLYRLWKNQNNAEKIYSAERWRHLRDEVSAAGYLLAHLNACTAEDVAQMTAALQQAVDSLTAPPVQLGDVDIDGRVTVSDVVALRLMIIGGTPTEDQYTAGDLNKDDELTVSDVVELRMLIIRA